MKQQITVAARLLQAGETVAFPTETVYGLGADISIPTAINQIFKIKGRPTDHPLIVHFSKIAQLQHWAQEIPDSAWKLAEHFWPGPLTLILQRSRHVSKNVTGGQETVGLRIPDHPIALSLLDKLGNNHALAAPSANRFGRVSPTTATHVREELGDSIGMILDGGACSVGLESTIISFDDQAAILRRPGGIPLEALEEILKHKITRPEKSTLTDRVPGALLSHYAPDTPLIACPTESLWQQAKELEAQGLQIIVITWSTNQPSQLTNKNMAHFSMPHEPIAYGNQLYAMLRQFDNKFDYLLLEAPPSTPAWLAITDRLQRACRTKPSG